MFCLTLKHKLIFTKLSEHMEYLPLAAQWAEEEWGYIRNKGVEYRKKVLGHLSEHTYIGILAGTPIAMFTLLHNLDSTDIRKKLPHTCELMYVYVEKRSRGLGIGKQIIKEAKRLAEESGADLIYLGTLKPSLSSFYKKHGAEFFCEGNLYAHPMDVLTITTKSKSGDEVTPSLRLESLAPSYFK